MQGFRAKGLDEEWVVIYNAYMVDKIVTKRSEYHLVRKHTTITYLQDGKALGAYHREKEKALAKGLLISNFDSTVKKPKRIGMSDEAIKGISNVVRPKRVKILNGYVTAER